MMALHAPADGLRPGKRSPMRLDIIFRPQVTDSRVRVDDSLRIAKRLPAQRIHGHELVRDDIGDDRRQAWHPDRERIVGIALRVEEGKIGAADVERFAVRDRTRYSYMLRNAIFGRRGRH